MLGPALSHQIREYRPSDRGDHPALLAGRRGIVIASPGGLAGGGGMGSVTRVMHGWMSRNRPDLAVDVIDPRSDGRAVWSLAYAPLAIARLIYLRARHGHEVLHLQVSERLSFARKSALVWVGRALNMRVVLHHHGAELIPFFRAASPRTRRLVRWMADSADINIVLGEVWRTFLMEEVGVAGDRIVVAANATSDLQQAKLAGDRDPWHFLVMANLSPRKGIGELLEAIAQLAHAGLPARLTLAGGGEIERYRQQAAWLGIAERCSFTGWIRGDDVTSLLSSHSALVLPSHHEGLPMTIIEALSARLPVVTTPVGSIPEHLEDDVTCLFVEAGNVAAIAAALKRMASDEDLRERLVANGRRLYEMHFDIGSYMGRMLALYERLLRPSGRQETT